MSKFNETILKKLEKWCDESDTQFTRFYYKEKNGIVTVYRYDGSGMPYKINSFVSNEGIEKFLNEVNENDKILSEYAAEIEKEMMVD